MAAKKRGAARKKGKAKQAARRAKRPTAKKQAARKGPARRKAAPKKAAPKKKLAGKSRVAPKKKSAAKKKALKKVKLPAKKKANRLAAIRAAAKRMQQAQTLEAPAPVAAPPPPEPLHFGLHQEVDMPQLADTAPKDEVWEIFRTYDRDNSGFIDRGELARLLEALGQAPTEEELAVALDVVDADHSGKISWREFSAWWRSR